MSKCYTFDVASDITDMALSRLMLIRKLNLCVIVLICLLDRFSNVLNEENLTFENQPILFNFARMARKWVFM